MRTQPDEMQDPGDPEGAARGDEGDHEQLERRRHAASVRGGRWEGGHARNQGPRGKGVRAGHALGRTCAKAPGKRPWTRRYTCTMVQARNPAGRRPRTPATPRAAASCRRPVDGLLDPGLFKALGDPTRTRLLACLMKCGRACLVGEVAECCAVDLSVVSRHLQALARAGVVERTREGRMVAYRVRYAPLAARFRDLAAAIDACAPETDGACTACCAPATRACQASSARTSSVRTSSPRSSAASHAEGGRRGRR